MWRFCLDHFDHLVNDSDYAAFFYPAFCSIKALQSTSAEKADDVKNWWVRTRCYCVAISGRLTPLHHRLAYWVIYGLIHYTLNWVFELPYMGFVKCGIFVYCMIPGLKVSVPRIRRLESRGGPLTLFRFCRRARLRFMTRHLLSSLSTLTPRRRPSEHALSKRPQPSCVHNRTTPLPRLAPAAH